MAGLKPTYETKDEIPEGASAFYTEQSDGTFKLNLDGGVKTQADIDKAMKALDRERDVRKAQAKVLKAVGLEVHEDGSYDEDAVGEVVTAKEKYDPNAEPGKGGKDVDKALQEQADRFKTEKQSLQEKLEENERRFKSSIKERDLKDALMKAGITNPIRLDDAVTRVMRTQEVDVKAGDDGVYKVVIGALRDAPEDFAREWASSEEGKHYVSANGNAGGGAGNEEGGGAITVNPYKEGSVNLTQQAKLQNESPEKARQLAAEAGVELDI